MTSRILVNCSIECDSLLEIQNSSIHVYTTKMLCVQIFFPCKRKNLSHATLLVCFDIQFVHFKVLLELIRLKNIVYWGLSCNNVPLKHISWYFLVRNQWSEVVEGSCWNLLVLSMVNLLQRLSGTKVMRWEYFYFLGSFVDDVTQVGAFSTPSYSITHQRPAWLMITT